MLLSRLILLEKVLDGNLFSILCVEAAVPFSNQEPGGKSFHVPFSRRVCAHVLFVCASSVTQISQNAS